MKDILVSATKQALATLNIEAQSIVLERPAEMTHGDFSTNAALMYAKQQKMNPLVLAMQIVEALKAQQIPGVAKLEVAGPGFINFQLTANSIHNALTEILTNDSYGKHSLEQGKKIVYEYTDPNPFKVFHIGHLMSNTIGESLSRLGEYSGATVKRYCYQGDVGRHIALTIWGFRFMPTSLPDEAAPLSEKVDFLGRAYAAGAQKFYEAEKAAEEKSEESDEYKHFKDVEQQVQQINKKLYDKSDDELNTIYEKGREWSLQQFEKIYEILGTKFDRYFFESEATAPGIEIVKANTKPQGLSIFEESEGAIIFPGEQYGLHTRVFITRYGLPGYEGKEVGLAKLKYEVDPYDKGITITASEQDDVMKVTQTANELLFPYLKGKLFHVSHGMLRLTTGKMSSRKGDVITGESLLNEMIEMALLKMADREMTVEEKHEVAKLVGVAAIKYTVLRQATGKDIIFDPEKSLSFEGDSGPYLQYSVVRAHSVLEKAKKENVAPSLEVPADTAGAESFGTLNWNGGTLERLLVRFPEVVERAYTDNAPHTVANYLMELAGTFNSFYASTQVIVKDDATTAYRVGLVASFAQVMEKGLWLLGIKVPAKM